MKGFDKEFTDFVDYILRITDRIWLEKNIGSISRYYGKDCVIHTLGGPVIGADAVIKGTIATLAAFPDRLLNAEDVIWGGNDETGFYSSHRIISPSMTNLGHSEFGPPTGNVATVRTIADCAALGNEIYEEWLMRDNLGLVKQIGFDPHEVARGLAQKNNDNNALHEWLASEISRVRASSPIEMSNNSPSPYDNLEQFSEQLLQGLWQQHDIEFIELVYDDAISFHGPGARDLNNKKEMRSYLDEILGTLKETQVSLDHLCSVDRGNNVIDVAVRWTLAGVHEQDGIYGKASDKDILILASSHWHIENGRITEEWTVFDELAVLRQVYSHI